MFGPCPKALCIYCCLLAKHFYFYFPDFVAPPPNQKTTEQRKTRQVGSTRRTLLSPKKKTASWFGMMDPWLVSPGVPHKWLTRSWTPSCPHSWTISSRATTASSLAGWVALESFPFIILLKSAQHKHAGFDTFHGGRPTLLKGCGPLTRRSIVDGSIPS